MTDLDRYLRHVHGDARYQLRFCTLDRSKPGRDGKGEWHETYLPHIPGEHATIAGRIKRAGAGGLDAYLCAHGYVDRTKPAQKPNAAEIACLWNEADAAQLPDPDAPDYPTMRIQTSPDREHWYLRLSRGISPEFAENLTQRWAQATGGDSGHALTKRLRPPGSRNFKRDGDPESFIIECDDERTIDPDDLDRILPPLVEKAPAQPHERAQPHEWDDDEPPVNLDADGLTIWRGKRTKMRDGKIDRSSTLQWIGYELAEAGATRKTIAAAVAERDMTLGATWPDGPKFANRPDADAQYWQIAVNAVTKVAANPRPIPNNMSNKDDIITFDEPCDDCGDDPCAALTRDNLRLRAENDQLTAEIDELKRNDVIQRGRIKLADEQLAIYRNQKIGAPKAVAAALVEVFRFEQPRDPGRVSRQTGGPVPYRVPLGLLKARTGLDEETCSRHVKGGKRGKGLADYTLPDGTPVVHWDVVDVPGSVDTETGEVTMPHSELWIGPGVEIGRFAEVLATLDPAERKPWGGKRNDGVCADHPDDGVIERVHFQKHVSYECATCNRVLDEKTIRIGSKAQSIRLLRHIPTPDDAGHLPTHDAPTPAPQDAGQDPAPMWNPLTYDPYIYADTPVPGPQDAPLTYQDPPVAPSFLYRNLRPSEPTGFAQRLLSGPTTEEEAAGLAAWGRPTPLDHRTDVAIGGRP